MISNIQDNNSDNQTLAIDIQGLTKTYSNGVKAIENINLEVKKGEFFALLGLNGAGKTTTIGVLTGLVNKTGGKVIVAGIDIDKQPALSRTHLGVVPQEFNFNMFEKVLDIVVCQGGYYGIPENIAKPRAIEILTRLGLESKLNMQARTLSGGMKRRLMIARALIHEPEILILDEPTAGVDVELRIGMWDYLKEINLNRGVTILLTTHYLEEVEALCHRAAIIKKGEIVKLDTVRNLMNSLEKESYSIELKNALEIDLPGNDFGLTKIDPKTLEASLSKTQTLNDLIALLTQNNIVVNGIRPKGNRLEELFVSVVNG